MGGNGKKGLRRDLNPGPTEYRALVGSGWYRPQPTNVGRTLGTPDQHLHVVEVSYLLK